MSDQAHHWSRAAATYEADYIDPYRPDVRNPLLKALQKLPSGRAWTAADLGCGIGPLLPVLADQFATVHAVDFASGMLQRARQRCAGLTNVEFVRTSLTDLRMLAGKIDVAVAVNSLVMPDLRDLEESLRQIRAAVRPGGHFLGIAPAMDAVHYYTMLLVNRALASGQPIDKARQNAACHADHDLYDFAFGLFRYQGLDQHFWQPFEVRHWLRHSGFRRIRLSKVHLSWKQFTCGEDLSDQPPPWDWFFQADG